MSSETTGAQDVPERPAQDDGEPTDVDHERGIDAICMEPGTRRTDNVEMLVIEAEFAANGRLGDNPAKPTSPDVFEQLEDRLEDTALRPAWIVKAEQEHATEADE